jgi:HAD superfamily hydrolase (TIGR01509 family)
MFKGKKVIIFDMDGTLIDSVGVWNKTDEILIRQLAGSEEVETGNVQQMRDNILAQCKSDDIYLEYCNYLGKKYNSSMKAEDILALRWQISDEYIKQQIDYKPNADVLLHLLKRKGYSLALATTTTNIQLDAYRNVNPNIRQKADIGETFDIVLSKEDVKEKKPSPEVHKKILQFFNVIPKDCLIIEDSLIGVQAGVNAGIEVAVIYDKYSDCDREEINRLSQYQFNNFEEILNRVKEELEPNIER